MANNPSTLPGYNGQTAAPDADYTYGSARNDAAPGDLTGTPRIAAEINDILGDQQSTLVSAGVVPSGSPDKVGASQYLQSRWIIHGSIKATIAAVVADLQLLPGTLVSTANYKSGVVGGGAPYLIKTAAQAATDGDVIDEIINHTMDNTNIAVLQSLASIQVEQSGAEGDNTNDDTDAVEATIKTEKKVAFDLTKNFKITAISLNTSFHLDGASITFEGLDAGFDIDTIIDGASMKDTTLIGDGNLANNQKGIQSNAALKNVDFSNTTLKNFVQGFDLNSAENVSYRGGLVEGSVGVLAGQGYGIIAGSSLNCTWSGTLYRINKRHALYLNNGVNQTITGNIFDKHREGEAPGGGLGALQISGEATAVAEAASCFTECVGPEAVVSPQPANTKPIECVSFSGGVSYLGESVALRVGGESPSADELSIAVSFNNKVITLPTDWTGSKIQIFSGFSIDVSSCLWHLKEGTAAGPIAIQVGVTTPDDDFFDNLSFCGHKGVFTAFDNSASFFKIAPELCTGTTRMDIFNNTVETDKLIDYDVTPTNPNIRTDSDFEQPITVVAGGMNIAGFNNFVVDAAGPLTVTSLDNGHEGKIVTLRFADTDAITFSGPNLRLAGGSFVSTNRDILKLQLRGIDWYEHDGVNNS